MNNFIRRVYLVANLNIFSLPPTILLFQRTPIQLFFSLLLAWVLVSNLLFVNILWGQDTKRPFYEYPGDYRQQVNELKNNYV